jgi:ribosomal protein L35AE/L33A
MLRDKKKDAQPKPSTAIEAIKQRSREMFDAGKYGSTKNEEAWQTAKTRQSREIDMLNSWAAANPKEAADATKVTAQYNEIRTKIYQEDMADGTAEMPKPEMLKPPTLNPRRVLEDPRLRDEEESPLDAVQLPLGDGSWQVTPKTRDQIKTSSRAGQRQVSLDFNSGVSTSRGVEIVIPHDATPEERAAAQAYVDKTVAWYQSKGIEVPKGRVLTKTGKGAKVSRFHTEPFYVQDADAMAAVQNDPDGYATILEDTLGRLSGVTFIAPHKTTDGGAQNDQINEREFARSYLVPALQRRKGGEPSMMAQNE